MTPTPGVETIRLTRCGKVSGLIGFYSVLRAICVLAMRRRHHGKTDGVRMSVRFAVALVATIGVGLVTTHAAQARPELVGVSGQYAPGTIVVHTSERRLYLILGDGEAVRYPVGVGKNGKQWAGTTQIDGKYKYPAWAPPAEVKHDNPRLPDVIPGGSPHNPMGVAAMTLSGGEYAIHGTNVPNSVGGYVSYGCIRMLNADITDLFDRVPVGTKVMVTR